MDNFIKIPDISPAHLLEQKDVLGSIFHAAFTGLAKKNDKNINLEELINKQFSEYSQMIEPRSNILIDEYLRFLKANVNSYKNEVPFHFFPQWSFPLIEKSLSDLPFSFIQIMNAGYKAILHNSIPRNEKLIVKSQLIKIEKKNNILYFTTKVTTEAVSSTLLLEAYLNTLIRISEEKPISGIKKEYKLEYITPFEAQEIASLKFRDSTGINYGILSGDINPVHWIEFYARMMGLKKVILHGFASSAFCIEALHQNLFMGDIHKIKEIEFKFTKPLYLPAKVKLYLLREKNNFYLSDSKLSRAYLVGNFITK